MSEDGAFCGIFRFCGGDLKLIIPIFIKGEPVFFNGPGVLEYNLEIY